MNTPLFRVGDMVVNRLLGGEGIAEIIQFKSAESVYSEYTALGFDFSNWNECYPNWRKGFVYHLKWVFPVRKSRKCIDSELITASFNPEDDLIRIP